MNRNLSVVLLIALLILAGCSHGSGPSNGDDDNDPPTIERFYDEESLYVTSDDQPLVEAEVSDADEVWLTYSVTDRSGTEIVQDERIDMSETDDDMYEADQRIPAQDPGYQVDITIEAENDHGTDTESESYTVSYVSSLEHPGTTSALFGDLDVTLVEDGLDDVQEVYAEYEVYDEETGEAITDGTTNGEKPEDRNVTLRIDHTDFHSDATVTYNVNVEYGNGTTMTYTHPEDEYVYTEQDEYRLLYVPVTPPTNNLSDDAEPIHTDIETLKERGDDMETYFYEESGHEVDFKSGWITDTPDDPYIELTGETDEYVEWDGDNIEEYDAPAVLCDVYDNHLDEQQREEHSAVVVVFADIPNQTDPSASDTTGQAGGNPRPDPKNRSDEADCDWKDEHEKLGNVQVSSTSEYNTYAHEAGHGVFLWPDYYGYKSGMVGTWGLMGVGVHNAGHPAQIISYNKQMYGWTTVHERSSSNLSEGDSFEKELDYQRLDGDALNVSIEEDREHSIFDTYLLEARDPQNVDHLPKRNDGDPPMTGQGVVLFGLTDTGGEGWRNEHGTHDVFLVRNQEKDEDEDDWDPDTSGRNHVTLDPDHQPFYDPDTGIVFEAVSTTGDGATVRVEKDHPENLAGVNIYVQVHEECEDVEGSTSVGDCDKLIADLPLDGNETDAVALHAKTDDGIVGMTENGTVVNEANGSMVMAGGVQKVFVDEDTAAEFVVETRDLWDDANVSMNLTTQTVVWDDEGTRTASELETTTVDPGEDIIPETARLELNRSTWHAGQHRTLEGNDSDVTVRNTGFDELENVTVTTDSHWIEVDQASVGTLDAVEESHVGVALDVPGGAAVGTHTANVTVSGEGVESVQTETVEVTVEVLPTVYWNATPIEVERDLAYANETTMKVTVTNEEASNVPLRDVETTVTGNVTRFDVDVPEPVETVQPNESVTLTTSVSVPDDGIDEGSYDGVIQLDTMQHHQQYVEFPIDVPDDHVVPDDEDHRTDVEVEAHGPSVDSTASFHPEEQVAMRQGSTTMTATVQPVTEEFEPPAEGITAKAEIPDGWELQGGNERATISVWVVETNDAGNEGPRTRLAHDDYEVELLDDALVIEIDDVRDTEYGDYLTTDEQLEFQVALNKDPKAHDHEYDATVDAETHSPWAIYRHDRSAAVIDVFDPRPGTAAEPVSDRFDRVPGHGVRVDDDGEGINGTLSEPRQISLELDGEDTWWLAMVLEADNQPDERVVWLPLDEYDGDFEGTVTDEGYLEVDGYESRSVHAAAASELSAATPVTIQLPADANLSANDTVTVADLHPSGSGENTTLEFVTPAGTPAATVNASVHTTDDDADIEIPVVVGTQLAPPDHEDESESQPALSPQVAPSVKAQGAG